MATIALLDAGGIDPEVLGAIAEASELPPGKIYLIVGDPSLHDDLQGVTFSGAFAHLAGNLYGLHKYRGQRWDCGVIIGQKWTQRQSDYPAYFAYLLGHEFAHATTILTDLWLTVYEDLIYRFIKTASDGTISRDDQLPHEIRYDQFGLEVATQVYGRERLEHDLRRIISSDLETDRPRLEKALELIPSKDLTGLREALAEFALPYREAFLTLWQEARERGHLRIAQGLSSLDLLWAPPNKGLNLTG